jgi:outer membrane protein OmpA-like peptidoglycan-associated protein
MKERIFMPDSILGSLLNMVDERTVGKVANAVGQPEQSVSRAMEMSIASLLAGVASKSQDPNALRGILDMVSNTTGDVTWPQIAGSVGDPNSPMMTAGKRALTALFGGGEKSVTSGISRESGLAPGAITSLLAMAAPVVMSYLNRQVREGAMTTKSLGGLLHQEGAAIRSLLPPGLSEMFWPSEAAGPTVSPVVAQAVQKERSLGWLAAPAIAALGLGFLWFLAHPRRTAIEQPVTTGEASRVATPAVNMVCTLPAGVNIPQGGVEAGFLAFVQNPDAKPVATKWFTLDKLAFDSGSATLRRQSQEQLNNIAAILTNCPTVRMKVAGYTDNVGAVEPNLRLSRNRANAVVALLVRKGVSPDRLAAEGFGEDSPIADNSTAQGRERNRRIAMCVTQK